MLGAFGVGSQRPVSRPWQGPRLVGYVPGYTARCRSLIDCEKLAEGEGFEPPRAWRPLRFSSAPFGVLGRAVRCRLEYA
jgi:hypothetical protein